MPISSISPWRRVERLWLLNWPLFALILLAYPSRGASPEGELGWAYFSILALTQAALYAWMTIIALPALVYFLSWKRLSPLWLASIFAVLACFVLLIDRTIFQLYRTHINLTLLQMALSPARAEIFDLTGLEYGLAGMVLLSLMAVQLGLGRLAAGPRLPRLHVWPVPVFLLMLFSLTGLHLTYAWADASYRLPVLQASELVPGFYGLTAKRFLARQAWLSVVKRPVLPEANQRRLHYPLHPLRYRPLNKPMNILMIAIDAWRYEDFNAETTPTIAGLAKQSQVYRQHFSGGNCTRAGLFSLFYSDGPQDFDAFYQLGRGPLLFDVLKHQGYLMAAFTSASATSPPFDRTVFANLPGFEASQPGDSSVERDQLIGRKARDFIHHAQFQGKPWFSFVFYDSAHSYEYPAPPFNPPFQPAAKLAHINLQGAEKRQLLHNQYRNALYFIDAQIGRLLSDLQQSGALDNTVVILTADHGEEFDDNGLGYWGHNGNFSKAQTQVPLIIHWPGQTKAAIQEQLTSHYDLIPTLFRRVLGVNNPAADYSLGQDLASHHRPTLILMGSYGKKAVYFPEYAVLAVTNHIGLIQLEDLHSQPTPKVVIPGRRYKQALLAMNHFH